MAYLKINGTDYSSYINKLKVSVKNNYKARTNAAGDTIAQYINSKHTLEIGFIHLEETKMAQLQLDIEDFEMNVSYLNPETRTMETIRCFIPNYDAEYFSIINNNARFKPFTITLQEL